MLDEERIAAQRKTSSCWTREGEVEEGWRLSLEVAGVRKYRSGKTCFQMLVIRDFVTNEASRLSWCCEDELERGLLC